MMSKEKIQSAISRSLENYFNNLGDGVPRNLYEIYSDIMEEPLLRAVMLRAKGNQSHAAEMLGINRNTLRKKLLHHNLL